MTWTAVVLGNPAAPVMRDIAPSVAQPLVLTSACGLTQRFAVATVSAVADTNIYIEDVVAAGQRKRDLDDDHPRAVARGHEFHRVLDRVVGVIGGEKLVTGREAQRAQDRVARRGRVGDEGQIIGIGANEGRQGGPRPCGGGRGPAPKPTRRRGGVCSGGPGVERVGAGDVGGPGRPSSSDGGQPTLPPALVQAAASDASVKPWPLQAFWPLQALLAVLQALWPLQALIPEQDNLWRSA